MSNKNETKIEYDGDLMFEQAYVQSRVILKKDGSHNIEFAVLGGPSISIDEPNEVAARAIYGGLDKAYRAGILELQEKMREALSSIQDDLNTSDSETLES